MIAIKSSFIKLIPQRRSCRRLVFVFSFILLLTSLGTISSCEKIVASSTSPSSGNEECSGGVCGPVQRSPIAHQPLALARYSILKQIEHQSGGSPFPGKTFATRVDVMFPMGQSDKVYILTEGYKFTKDGYPLVKLVCYKSNCMGVKLFYSVKLKIVYKPAKDKTKVKNLLDYLSLLGDSRGHPPYGPYSYTLPENISKVAKSDLSLSQKLVDYSCETVIQVLYVRCFSSKVAESIDEQEYMQAFDIPGNTSSPEQSQWYKTYGFPVADCELDTKSGKKK